MKATRIAYSKELNEGKRESLTDIAARLGVVRAKVWREYGSISGLGPSHRDIRDMWMKDGTAESFGLPARLWKETLRDTFADITAYREAAKVEVRKSIRNRSNDDDEQKRLYTLLKYDKWMADDFLRRQMRKHFKHGATRVDNQIVLDTDCYTTFSIGEKAWIDAMSLTRGKRIAIPINTTVEPLGTLRLILRGGRVEVHYTIEINADDYAPCGEQKLGIDKGYTEAFTDSDGERHGQGLGDILGAESDYLKAKYQNRNKLKAIAEAKPHKRTNIENNNLGRSKLDHRRSKHTANVRDVVFKAAHSVADKAEVIVTEDLTSPIKDKRKYGKNQSRRLSAWVKGTMAEALESVSQRRRSSLKLVNASYTSQTDSRYGVLLGQRSGDLFYCFDGEVLDADANAAQNILDRLGDSEIQLFTPYQEVRKILLKRTEQQKRLGLLNLDTSCNGSTMQLPLSTVSELPL